MKGSELTSIALRFNEAINTRNLTRLGELMTEDHTFIDIPGEIYKGRERMLSGWFEFFSNYPDYRNNFTHITMRGSLVVMVGFSECSYAPLNGPAIWTAKIRNGKVAEWRVYEDTQQTRKKLGID